MELWQFLSSCLAIAVVIRFFIMPRLARALPQMEGQAVARRCGLLAMLGFLASAAQIAAISGVAVLLLVWWLSRGGGTTLPEVTALISRIQFWRSNVEEMTFFSSGLFLFLVLVGFALYFRRRGKIRAQQAIHRAAEREFERLKQKFFSGELSPLPPTPEMEQIDRELERMQAVYDGIDPQQAQNDPKIADLKKGIESDASKLLAHRARCDISRRISLKLDPEDAALPQPRTRWEKIEVALMSRGLLMNLSRARRAIGYVALALLVPAFFSFNARLTSPLLNDRETKLTQRKIAFEQIEIKVQREKDAAAARQAAEAAEAAWEQIAQASAQQPAQTATTQDDQTANILAAKFEYESASRGVWNAALVSLDRIYEVQSFNVRDQILQRAAAQRPEHIAAHAAFAETDLSKAEQELLLSAIAEPEGLRPHTRRGAEFKEKIKTVLSHAGSNVRERARAEAAAWRQPARRSEFQRAILSHFTDVFIDGSSPPFADALTAVSDMQRDAFRRFDHAAATRAATQWANGADVSSATQRALDGDRVITSDELAELQRIVRTEAEQLPGAERMAGIFRDHPPALRSVENRQAVAKAAEALDEFRHKHIPDAPYYSSMADSVEVYDDYFPGQAGGDQRTAASNIRRSFEDNVSLHPSSLYEDVPAPPTGGGGLPNFPGGSGSGPTGSGERLGPVSEPHSGIASRASGVPHIGNPSSLPRAGRANFVRARSFSMLRGFSRVGGVLIGREPETNDELPLADLRWESADKDKIRLIVRDDHGKEIRSGPLHARIVYQALIYAADQRPTAVTMAKADPLFELKILIHPALLDTTLGSNIIDLDRFVDKYTHPREDGFRRRAETRIRAEDELYRLTWATRMLMLKCADTEKLDALVARFAFAAKVLDRVDEKRATAALGAGFAAEDQSPLAVKNEFYDADLVKVMKQAAATSDNLADYINAVRRLFQTRAAQMRDLFDDQSAASRNATKSDEEEVRKWLCLPPKFEIWSGVRELPFRNNLNEIFPTEAPSSKPILDFMLQVAFTSDPQFGPNRVTRKEDVGSYSDTVPWEFPALKEQIRDTIQQSLDPQDRAILSIANEFAILQRFFRLAFLSRFGNEFPVAKLNQLATELEKSTKLETWMTPRWNPNPGALEELAFETLRRDAAGAGNEEDSASAVQPAIKTCTMLAANNLSRRKSFRDQLTSLLDKRKTSDQTWNQKWAAAWDREEAAQVQWEGEWIEAADHLASLAQSKSLSPEQRDAVEIAGRTSTALKVRRALDVSRDERRGYEVQVGLRKAPAL
jgi:hypothetical protein